MHGMTRACSILALAIALAFFASSSVFATGWNDYELDIGDGFHIVRCNSLDVCLADSSNQLIYHPEKFDSSGPINAYSVSPNAILLRTYGRTPRNLFAGDTFENVDTRKEYFFVYDRSTQSLSNPLSANDPLLVGFGSINWTRPKNPNPTFSFVAAFVLLAIIAIVIGVPLLLVCTAVTYLYRLLQKPKRAPDGG